MNYDKNSPGALSYDQLTEEFISRNSNAGRKLQQKETETKHSTGVYQENKEQALRSGVEEKETTTQKHSENIQSDNRSRRIPKKR